MTSDNIYLQRKCDLSRRNLHLHLLVQLGVELLPLEAVLRHQGDALVVAGRVRICIRICDAAVLGRVAHLLEEEPHLAANGSTRELESPIYKL